jgi:hypothetical protein
MKRTLVVVVLLAIQFALFSRDAKSASEQTTTQKSNLSALITEIARSAFEKKNLKEGEKLQEFKLSNLTTIAVDNKDQPFAMRASWVSTVNGLQRTGEMQVEKNGNTWTAIGWVEMTRVKTKTGSNLKP